MDEDDVVRPMPRRRPQRPARGPATGWRRWRRILFWVLVPVVLVFGSVMRFWVDLMWFGELGHRDVLVTRLQWGLAMGIAFGLVTFAVLYVNFVVARRVARNDLYVPFLAVGADPEAPEQPVVPHFVLKPILLGIAVVAGVLAGLIASSRWEVVLRWLGRTDFGVTDPHFGRDASFYVFTMPLLELITRSMQVLIVVTAMLVIGAYVATGVIRYTPVPRIARGAIIHLSWLVAAFLVVSAFSFRLSMWNLATSASGVVTGAGWTDVHARIPGYWLLILASLVLAVVVVLYARRENWRVVGGAVVGWFAASLILTGLVPSIVQKVIVEPNELDRESKLLQGNIANTRAAFGLEDISTRQFRDQENLDANALLRDNTGTTDNLRLWSPFVLGNVVRQEQAIRRYFTFGEPDVDRYTIQGDYRQIMVAVRELEPGASAIAPGWTNERLAYTHGYGLVATLPNEVTRQGKPEYLVKDLPPKATKEGLDFKLERPEVYFGEATTNYVIVGTKQREISGGDSEGGSDTGGSNARTSYSGKGGIRVKSPLRRLALATTFRDPRILFSSQFTDKSRFMFRREVTERVTTLAPFLSTDADPYAVVIDGRIKWVVDAYTTSDRFPYSNTPEASGSSTSNTDAPASGQVVNGVNYLRNSVKAVVDAYDGDVTLYTMDDEDPILAAWRHIFPDLFTPASKMPDEVRAHLRYPEDLFEVQSSLWRRYHMTDVSDFFQREDEWAIPTIDKADMQAYYVLAKLPGAKKEELLLIRPFTPKGKKNMVAYLVAHSDGEQYGNLDTLELSTQELTQGPSQVQALIKQDSDVARQVREWTTGNNQVIFGDLLVLPIEQSLLYVQPVYLQNSEAEIPEFQKITLVLGDTIAWGDDYPSAVEALLAERAGNVTAPKQDGQGAEQPDTGSGGDAAVPTPAPGDLSGLSRDEALALLGEITSAYDKADACQRAGDTVCYAEQMEKVEQLLADARGQR
ncbi:MAG: UPF0182 family protein [Thermoleophilia bacterium]|nr:UPF0182 family protein [Thermoleophilia bacterium]